MYSGSSSQLYGFTSSGSSIWGSSTQCEGLETSGSLISLGGRNEKSSVSEPEAISF